jgi:hypothetical protein
LIQKKFSARGPTMDIRPSPEDIILWAAGAGLKRLDLPPYHLEIPFHQGKNPALRI